MGGPGAPKKSGKEQSERYVQQRFSREFEHTLQGIESSEDGFLNYRNTGELLVLMGFISGNPVHQAQERILLANLWKGVGVGIISEVLKVPGSYQHPPSRAATRSMVVCWPKRAE